MLPAALRSHRVALLAGLGLFALAEAMAFAGVGTFPHLALRQTLLGNPFIGPALLASFLMMLVVSAARDRLAITALGAVFEAGFISLRGELPLWEHRSSVLLHLGTGFGLAAIAFALGRRVLRKAPDPVSAPGPSITLPALLLLPSFIVLSQYFLELTVVLHPSVLDPALVHADAAFGTQWSLVFGAFAEAHPPWFWLLGVVYLGLPLACAVVFTGETRQPSREVDVLTSFIVAGLAGSIIYHLCPVVGPRPFLPDYPSTMPDLSALLPVATAEGVPGDVRNCVPSLHTAWGLLVWWHGSRLGGAFRGFGLAFFLLTECATLALGEHYVLDLVVAFPFTVLVHAVVRRVPWSPVRIQTAVFGAASVGLWLGLLRVPAFVTAQPAVLALSLVSVVGSLVLEARLTRMVRSLALGA
jgi:hypothetical protein